jgi:hypothetical protein
MGVAFDRVGWLVLNVTVIVESVLSGNEIVLPSPPDVIAERRQSVASIG